MKESIEPFAEKYNLTNGRPVRVSEKVRLEVEVLYRDSDRAIQAGEDYCAQEKRLFGFE